MQKKFILVFDLESCPINKAIKGVDAHNMLAYDLGYRIIDLKGKVYIERSYVIANTFLGEEEKMKSAYYAEKLPQYKKDIIEGKRKLRTWEEVRKALRSDIEKYKVNVICAHNAYFDYTCINTTKKYFDKDYMLPYGIEWWDSLKMVRSTIATTKKYKKFCIDNGLLTEKTKQPKTTAEVVYKYITQNLDFKESHTGLEDTQIESEIILACYKTHKKMNRKLWND